MKNILLMALEFRLSLANLCKLYRKEATEENKMEMYEKIELSTNKDSDLIERIKYLFFVETDNEPQNISIHAYYKAINFINRYTKAKKEGNKEEVAKIFSELHNTEKEFKKIESKLERETLDAKEIDIVTKYRIKHVIPRQVFCRNYGVSESKIRTSEERLESHITKAKLEKLSEYSAIMASKYTMKKRR